MHAHPTFPTETICTCGFLLPSNESSGFEGNVNLTLQIGNLLVALGSIFASVPLFKMHLNPGTATLLVSIGRKLLRSVEKTHG